MASLRKRLLVGTIAGTLLVLSLAGSSFYLSIRRLLQDDFNAALAAKARALAGLVEEDNGKLEFEIDYRTMREFEPGSRCEYFELRRIDGTLLFSSHSLGAASLNSKVMDDRPEAFQPLLLPDGRPGRLVRLMFRPRLGTEEGNPEPSQARSPPPLRLTVARETHPLSVALTRVTVLLIAVGAGATLLSALVLNLVVRRGLRPLDRLAGQIGGIGEDVATRVDLPNAPAELRPVVERLNSLLGRLQAAMLREKRFTADVAHELRTPLAGLRSTLEVCLSRARDPAAYQSVAADCLTITRQMQAMVDNLLALARLELGQLRIELQRVVLEDRLRDCWAQFAGAASEHGLQVRWETDPSVAVQTDPERLRQVMSNLFDNAMTYANRGGEIRIAAGELDGQIFVCVANTGSTLSQAEAEHACERFWRGDAARKGTGVHCGLGLSLAKEMVTLLGASMSVQSEPGGEFVVRVAWPHRAGDSLPPREKGTSVLRQ